MPLPRFCRPAVALLVLAPSYALAATPAQLAPPGFETSIVTSPQAFCKDGVAQADVIVRFPMVKVPSGFVNYPSNPIAISYQFYNEHSPAADRKTLVFHTQRRISGPPSETLQLTSTSDLSKLGWSGSVVLVLLSATMTSPQGQKTTWDLPAKTETLKYNCPVPEATFAPADLRLFRSLSTIDGPAHYEFTGCPATHAFTGTVKIDGFPAAWPKTKTVDVHFVWRGNAQAQPWTSDEFVVMLSPAQPSAPVKYTATLTQGPDFTATGMNVHIDITQILGSKVSLGGPLVSWRVHDCK